MAQKDYRENARCTVTGVATCTLANESVDVIRVVWSAHLFITLAKK